MESKESASAHVQGKSDLDLLRETMSERVLPLDMPESECERREMQTLGPQRWRNQVQDVDLHECVSLLELKVQVLLTTAYKDVVADDEHSDTDDEDQNAEYHEYHTSVHSITAKNGRLVVSVYNKQT